MHSIINHVPPIVRPTLHYEQTVRTFNNPILKSTVQYGPRLKNNFPFSLRFPPQPFPYIVNRIWDDKIRSGKLASPSKMLRYF